ncbi:protein-tyrosine-phosphatase [Malassezia cuniculi]|uniref:M-phase inducer phosphatase n=1 Tax=Malassezia cuniculi TaxID=948313 RepID=A0AAF0F0H9_9BASI|nr:protein-tyrosine-phosphatase [Malassezia cuniculi]
MSPLSSPGEVGAWESKRVADPPSSPSVRDGGGQLLQDIDRSFGSSMSISSIESPRTRAFARVVAEEGNDPFSFVLGEQPGVAVPNWLLSQRAGNRSSPHAMEISSPAVPDGLNQRPLCRLDPTQRYSVPLGRSPQDCSPFERNARALSTGAVPCGDRSIHSEPSSPAGPPLKKRLSALYRLQKNELEWFGPNVSGDSNISRDDSNASQDDSRVSQISQNAAWFQGGDTFSSQEADSSLLGVAPPPADVSPAACAPSDMGRFFFSPDSPNVSLIPQPIPAVRTSPNSSPGSSPLRSLLGAPFAPNIRRCASIAVPNNAETAIPPPPKNDLDIALDMDEGDESVLEGSPVRPPPRAAPRLGGPARAHSVVLAGERCAEAIGSTCLPGFGSFEQDHKILPCHPVKCDGLMRITPDTLVDLLQGKYNDKIHGYCIVDCRFAYEYEGGHVAGAINLNTTEKVRSHFLECGCGMHANSDLPSRTQSGAPDENGDVRKFLLIFHCEFSWKRAPSMALSLRQADRALAHDYPNCHFPDIYILEGGYSNFFAKHPEYCEPRAYIQMDDPRFMRHRSEELTGFRKQFTRNRSFAYGDGRIATAAAATIANSRLASGRLSVSRTLAFSRTTTETKENAPPAASLLTSSKPPFPAMKPLVRASTLGMIAPAQLQADATRLDVPPPVRDASFSSAGDSSFDGDGGDSPCAVATSRRPLFEQFQVPRARSPVSALFARPPSQRT